MEKYLKMIHENIDMFIANVLKEFQVENVEGAEEVNSFIPDIFPYLSILYLIKSNCDEGELEAFILKHKEVLLAESQKLKSFLGYFLITPEINEQLKEQIGALEAENKHLRNENLDISNKNHSLSNDIMLLNTKNTKLSKENSHLKSRLADLESTMSDNTNNNISDNKTEREKSIQNFLTVLLDMIEKDNIDYNYEEKENITTQTKALSLHEDVTTCARNIVRKSLRQNPIVNPKIRQKQKIKSVIDNLISNMVYVEGGTFRMGYDGYGAFSAEKPVHLERVESFHICKYQVTQAEWQAVMGNNPSDHKGENLPVEMVSWDDCQEFISRLNEITGKNFRLPTEAEWEYAARGGNSSKGYEYSGNFYLGNVGWYNGNSQGHSHPVGQKTPNELGLYDMSGNVAEWTHDQILRGGYWDSSDHGCRVSFRFLYIGKKEKNQSTGLRLAL